MVYISAANLTNKYFLSESYLEYLNQRIQTIQEYIKQENYNPGTVQTEATSVKFGVYMCACLLCMWAAYNKYNHIFCFIKMELLYRCFSPTFYFNLTVSISLLIIYLAS